MAPQNPQDVWNDEEYELDEVWGHSRDRKVNKLEKFKNEFKGIRLLQY